MIMVDIKAESRNPPEEVALELVLVLVLEVNL